MKISDEQFTIIHDSSLSVKDAAVQAGCSESTVRKYRKAAAENVESLEAKIADAQMTEEAIDSAFDHEPDEDGVCYHPELGETHVIEADVNMPGAIESLVASYDASLCKHRPQGSAFMCGLRSDHQSRNISHCHGTRVPV